MNILIPSDWIYEYLKTSVKPKKLADYLSLCGPTVEKIEKKDKRFIFDFEVTTNRVDQMSVLGIVREAKAILPQFKIKAQSKEPDLAKVSSTKRLGIEVKNNPKLCKRILAVKLEGVKIKPSPKLISERLQSAGQRPLNNIIDITNYVMWEMGHPIHAFDYDKIKPKKIIVREAKKKEKLTTLDNKTHTLEGGEVVFDNSKGQIIDLPGIMGTKNTVVDKNTKNVLLWIESVKPEKIRSASLNLNIRSQAAILNEKGVDPELGEKAILRAIKLFQKYTGAKVKSELLDIKEYEKRQKEVQVDYQYLTDRLGVEISKKKIEEILTSLDFSTNWTKDKLTVQIPSFRDKDIDKKEDILEEVARIYGYHKLPSKLMTGVLPDKPEDSPFEFEDKLKQLVKELRGIEIYTLSLVPKEWIDKDALKLKNPLGSDSKYLRTTLRYSLVKAAKENSAKREPFHLFEMANIYLPKKSSLPQEKMMLSGIFVNENYRQAKGVVEKLLEKLNIKPEFGAKDSKGFQAAGRLEIYQGKTYLGEFGILEEDFIYYEFEVESLKKSHQEVPTYRAPAKYPPQIEDITLVLPERTKVLDIIDEIKGSSKFINKVILLDIYKDSFTFQVYYQNPRKTLTDVEVKEIRQKLLTNLKKKYTATLKS